jgi:hypothetical protein
MHWDMFEKYISILNQSAIFVGSVVGFLNVLVIRLRSLLLAAALSFDRVRTTGK